MDIDSLMWMLGYNFGSLSSSYIRLLLGASFKPKVVWKSVIERIASGLEPWKAALLSKGGELTLLKSTLASIPNYFLSLFTISVSMTTRIESNFHNFLWNDSNNHHLYHLVDWKNICRPLCSGSLLGMYSLALDPKAWHSRLMMENIWLPRLRRNLNDRELSDICRILRLLDGLNRILLLGMVGNEFFLGKVGSPLSRISP